jgi:colanic acid biosynthesis glycosyl transferase WcaI
MIAVTPSFPALAAAMAFGRARVMPWVMWVQDLVTDGATTTGALSDGPLMHAARSLERASYRSANRIVVISEAFRENLIGKGVPSHKIERIFNPSTREAETPNDLDALAASPPRILAMGNIGHSQGLDRIVDAFQASEDMAHLGARLIIAGNGVAADAVRSHIRSDSVSMPGVLYDDELTPVLRSASIGLVTQRASLREFNFPSKLMNYMAYGIPVVASVDPASEAARIVRESGAGWVTDAANPAAFAEKVNEVLRDRDALRHAGRAGYAYARAHFRPSSIATRFEGVLNEALGQPKAARQAAGGSPGRVTEPRPDSVDRASAPSSNGQRFKRAAREQQVR